MNAVISSCQRYRYFLERHIKNSSKKTVLFIMLNPSTADHQLDDPTIRRCLSFANRLEASTLKVINLFAYRTTYPDQLYCVADPYGPLNKKHQKREIERADTIICAWGAKGTLFNADKEMYDLINSTGKSAYALALTKNNHPRHPLYVRNDADLIKII